MKEIRLKYNDRRDLKPLLETVEDYIDTQPKNKTGVPQYAHYEIIKYQNFIGNKQFDVVVRTTKTGIIIAEIRKYKE